MIDLILQAPHVAAFRPQLMRPDRENCLVLFTRAAHQTATGRKLLTTEYRIPEDRDYLRRDLNGAVLAPAFVADVTKRAARRGLGLVFAHSHPESVAARFSATDNSGEKLLAEFLEARLPNGPHLALVVTETEASARVLGAVEPVRVTEVGARRVIWTTHTPAPIDLALYDRQIMALGSTGQRQIGNLRVGIVGLGGTGSIVAQELAHLGVRDFLLVDPDVVDASNLNRLVGATSSSVGSKKVDVALQSIVAIAPDALVDALCGDVIATSVARRLADVDVIFSCTDSHGSRAILQQVAYQFLVPCFDMGSIVVAKDGMVKAIFGRVQLLAPGLPCLTCTHLLDPNQVRRDMMTSFEKKSDPYIPGEDIATPSVISLNATVASLAVTMLLQTVTELPGSARSLLYNALSGSVKAIAAEPDPECYVCSSAGTLARGDSAAIRGRLD